VKAKRPRRKRRARWVSGPGWIDDRGHAYEIHQREHFSPHELVRLPDPPDEPLTILTPGATTGKKPNDR
jgi:hypothetical protein